MAEFDGKMNRAVIVDEEDDPKMYLVHFEGWNARYDQWVDESRVKFNVPVQPKKEYETPNPIEKKSKLETSKKEDEKAETGSPQLSHQKSYEQQRLENIRRNQEMLRLLNLEGLAAGLRKPKKAKIVKKLKKTEKPSKPSRRSLRVQGLGSDGKKLPDNFKGLATYVPDIPKLEEGSLQVSASNKDFLKELIGQKGEDGGKNDSPQVDAPTLAYAHRLSELCLAEKGVSKVTKERIYSVAIHPSESSIMCAAGDKRGNLGLWKIGGGVAGFHPHGNVIAGLLFDVRDSNRLYTSSYDGRIRMLDLKAQALSDVYHDPDTSFYEINQHKSTASCIYACDVFGVISAIDPRAKSLGESWQLHENKVFTVRVNEANPHQFVTASLDRTVRVWDSRKIKKSNPKALFELIHGLCVTGASFSPDGKYLQSCCNDDLIRVWECSKMSGEDPDPSSQIRHNNRTGRWLTKFKCEWDPKQSNAFVVGSLDRPRCIQVFSAQNSAKFKLTMRLRDDDYLGSVQSVNVFHPTLDVIASANSSGRCHVWQKYN